MRKNASNNTESTKMDHALARSAQGHIECASSGSLRCVPGPCGLGGALRQWNGVHRRWRTPGLHRTCRHHDHDRHPHRRWRRGRFQLIHGHRRKRRRWHRQLGGDSCQQPADQHRWRRRRRRACGRRGRWKQQHHRHIRPHRSGRGGRRRRRRPQRLHWSFRWQCGSGCRGWQRQQRNDGQRGTPRWRGRHGGWYGRGRWRRHRRHGRRWGQHRQQGRQHGHRQ